MPYGAFNGLVAIALPYILRQRGFSIDRIASISAIVQAPAIWYFLWSPIVDVGLRRRTWVVVLSVASAIGAALAIGVEFVTGTRLLTALLILASAFSQPVSSAIGGLVATVMPNSLRGRTAGWSQAGMLIGGIVTGGVGVIMTLKSSPAFTALTAGLLIALPSLAALAVREPRPSTVGLRTQFTALLRDVTETLRRRDVWIGLVFFLSPIGAGALSNLFAALASDFQASTDSVILVVIFAGVLTPVGALIGGYLCDKFDRWRIYAIAGLTAAASTAGMFAAPLTPANYVVGAAAYSLTTGFCYAAFMSLAFELVGSKAEASGTRFTLFMAAVNVPVVYMLRLDGLGHAHWGVRGMLAVDSLANAIFGLVLLIGLSTLRRMVGIEDTAAAN